MRIYDLIAKKRDGGTHSREELEACFKLLHDAYVSSGFMTRTRPAVPPEAARHRRKAGISAKIQGGA